MKVTFSNLLHRLQAVLFNYEEEASAEKINCLRQLGNTKLPANHQLEKYCDTLIFISAHPPNSELYDLVGRELQRISVFLKKQNANDKSKWVNTGLPYTKVVSNFSIDLVQWMLQQEIPLALHDFDEQGEQFKNILKFTLPEIEREVTAIEDKNGAFLKELHVNQRNILHFILAEFERLKDQPLIKDYFYDELKLTFSCSLSNLLWSKSYNRVPVESIYYHEQLIKKLDHVSLINSPVNKITELSMDQKKELIRVCKLKLILLQRETEPVNYMNESSFRYYELDRGITIALYDMIPSRQLPLESYVGYTLFRNGFPAAYGGAWILGRRALFGINIFDWFRGGESGYILCQLLRTYRQIFSIDYFEVEPYQYGLNNPEGIESGAFWFYYKYGFRPLKSTLQKLVAKEREKIDSNKEYRTSHATLGRFTESNVALQLGNSVPIAMWQIRNRITEMIHTKYKDNRAEAERECMSVFMQKSFFKRALDNSQLKVMTDVALMCEAFQWNSENIYRLLEQMVLEKPKDVYRYQQLVLKLFQLVEKY